MSEPKAKKSKMSTKEFTFTKENKPCDRKLLVQKSVFHVNSEILIEHSHYFRAMLTSNFIEKEKSEIELKEVDEEGMKKFLTVLFEPEKMKIEDVTELSTMCKVFVYFLATEYFVKFLVETKVYKGIADRFLLEMGVEHGIPEMKEAIDNSLAERFRQKFPDTAERPLVKKGNVAHFKFHKNIFYCLNLVIDFGLQNLKETVETHLSFEYNRSPHFRDIEEKYVELMSNYQLEELRNVIEPYALSQFVANHDKPKELLENYVTPAIPVEMNQLKEAIENHYVAEFKQTWNKMRLFNNMLTIANSHNLQKVKDSIEEFLLDRVKSTRFDGRPLWESLKYCWFYMNAYRGSHRSEPVAQLFRMFNVSDKYELSKLKTHMEQLVSNGLDELIKDSGKGIRGGLSLHSALLSFAKKIMECARHSEIVKATLDHLFVSLVKKNIKSIDVEEYSDYLRYCRSYNFVELKKSIRSCLCVYYQEVKEGRRIKLSMNDLAVLALKHNVHPLKEDFEADVISEFLGTHSFENLRFAFTEYNGYRFKQFRRIVRGFLKTVSLDDPIMKAGRKHILDMGTDKYKLFLKALLRK